MMRIILGISFLLFVCSLSAQRDHQLQLDPGMSKDTVWVMVSDTSSVSPYYGRGKWEKKSVVVGSGGSDSDWYKHSTTTAAANTDSAFHEGKIFVGDFADTITNFTGAFNLVGRLDMRYPYGYSNNIVIGGNAGGVSMGTSGRNISIGDSTFYNSHAATVGSIAIGGSALMGGVGGRSVAVGFEALRGGTGGPGGGYSTGIGYQALRGSGAGATHNTGIGAQAGYTNSTGDRNIFIGYQAGYNETNSDRLYIESSNSASPLIFGNFAADSILINGKLGYTTNGGTPTRLAGRSGTQFSDVTPGNGLSLDNGRLDVFPTIINDYYVQSDSLCLAYSYIIGGTFNHDTLCISIDSVSLPQDSTFITGDSICVIEMGDTTCLTIGDLLDTHIGNTDLTLTSNRALNTNNKTLFIGQGPNSSSPGFLINLTGSTKYRFSAVNGIATYSMSDIQNTINNNSYQRFMNPTYTFSHGIRHDIGAYVWSDSTNVGNPILRYHFAGDTLSIMKRTSFYANVGIGRQASSTHRLDVRGRLNLNQSASVNNIFINGGNNTASGTGNIAVGVNSGTTLSSGTNNILINGGVSLTSGSNNIMIGSNLIGRTATLRSIFIGIGAGAASGANQDSCVAIGHGAGSAPSSAGYSNKKGVMIGNDAGRGYSGNERSVVIGDGAAQGDGSAGSGGTRGSVIIGPDVGSWPGVWLHANVLYIDNSDTTRPLIQGDFANDTLRINGVLQVDGGTIVDEDGNPITGGGGGGDDWGSQVVVIDSTLTGDGTSGSVLGVKKRRSRDVSTQLELDRMDYYVNVTGGSVTDTIFLPEVATASIDWSGLTSDQVGVGQTYVITNFRISQPVIVCAYNPAGGTSDDLLGTLVQPGGSAGSAISINPGQSFTIESFRYASSIGYWRVSP